MTIDLVVYVDGCPWGQHKPHGQNLYALLDAAGRALYVGRTRRLAERIRHHRRKPWWSEVADVISAPVCCIDVASHAEIRAMRALSTPYNVDPRENARRGHATRLARTAS